VPEKREETADQIDALASELGDCRQRGIERIDRQSHNQARVTATVLEQLAADYVAARQLPVYGRIPQIKALLRHALDDLSSRGSVGDASLIRDLFFGDSPDDVSLSAGELLENAQRKRGESSEVRFRERRQTAFHAFAGFLPQFVAEAAVPDSEQSPVTSPAGAGRIPFANDVPAAGSSDSELHYGAYSSGYVEHGERFVTLLSEAANVTIVGFTNEQLAERLEEALQRRRSAHSRFDVFWSSLRIVYLSPLLLDFLNDERSEYPDRHEAVNLRRRAAGYGRRSVSVFLRRAPSSRWTLYETTYMPPFIGTLFEMPDGKRVVQLLITRPQRSTPDHRYIEIEDLPDQYFTAAFEDIVHNSVTDNQIVPIGVPAGDVFRCTGRRYRQKVLADGSGATGWLPLVLIVTYQRHAGLVEPVLQLRTVDNAARELDRLSHLSGHIYHEAVNSAAADDPQSPLLLGLHHDLAVLAARRRVQMDVGEDLPEQLVPVGTGSYLQHDKEHMFFFIYRLELPEEFQLPRRSEMHRFPIPELFAVRQNQSLRKALLLLTSARLSPRMWAAAREIAALNLFLHDYHDQARQISLATQDQELGDLVSALAETEFASRQSWYTRGRDVELFGLSGLQYREFYSVLLPLYAEIGVSGAGEQLAHIRDDEEKRAAVDRISELYHNDVLMSSLPIEL
jgi:hypothetical protein